MKKRLTLTCFVSLLSVMSTSFAQDGKLLADKSTTAPQQAQAMTVKIRPASPQDPKTLVSVEQDAKGSLKTIIIDPTVINLMSAAPQSSKLALRSHEGKELVLSREVDQPQTQAEIAIEHAAQRATDPTTLSNVTVKMTGSPDALTQITSANLTTTFKRPIPASLANELAGFLYGKNPSHTSVKISSATFTNTTNPTKPIDLMVLSTTQTQAEIAKVLEGAQGVLNAQFTSIEKV